MKLLLDSCVAPSAMEALRMAGHDVVWAGQWPTDPGDELVFKTAVAEGRVLVTIDKDFGDKSTRILIYCNNNFENEEAAFPRKMAAASLNLSTYVSLYSTATATCMSWGRSSIPRSRS